MKTLKNENNLTFNLKERKIDLSEMITEQKLLNEILVNSIEFNQIKAFVLKWPYIVFSGIQNHIWIINLFDISKMNLIKIPIEMHIEKTYITQSENLVIVFKANDLKSY